MMKGQEQERVPAVQNIGSYIQGWKFLCAQNNRKRDNRLPDLMRKGSKGAVRFVLYHFKAQANSPSLLEPFRLKVERSESLFLTNLKRALPSFSLRLENPLCLSVKRVAFFPMALLPHVHPKHFDCFVQSLPKGPKRIHLKSLKTGLSI
ncbi:hypothetical protein VNO80_15853 [Phaseolus coccineus]|uniref:Uncharacterized protein n=1 Tax=Phaseolus coccineus TaxID=3886 RepID=A0AAN9MQM4_PHACN